MTIAKWLATTSTALLISLSPPTARAADKVVIGDIDDMSGLYADINGPRAVEAINMAIADFGGSALGQPIELLTADHQNKPDIRASKFREWADTGVTIYSAAPTPVRARHGLVAKEKKIPFSRSEPQASLSAKTATPYDPLQL
jgi:branched-chain amino acid transport system substrate-binding protein